MYGFFKQPLRIRIFYQIIKDAVFAKTALGVRKIA